MGTRIALLLATAIGTVAVASSAAAATGTSTAGEKTIVGVAAGDKRFTTLVTLVKQAGLVKTLSGARKRRHYEQLGSLRSGTRTREASGSDLVARRQTQP